MMMRINTRALSALLTAALVAGAVAPAMADQADALRAAQLQQPNIEVNAEAAQQASADLQAAPIHTPADIVAYASVHPTDSPLLALSPLDRQVFLDSLRYNASGVTSFRYDVLEHLTPSQAHEVLALIGQQSFTSQLNLKAASPTDQRIMKFRPSLIPLKGYLCEGRGTCTVAEHNACAGTC